MLNAKLTVHPSFVIAEVDPRLYSGFIEHMGRAVYEGIFQPGCPQADDDGFRQDVIDLIRDLDMPLTRYPGGNFVSGYNWEDGVGPRDQRPVRLDLAWRALEPNTFGTDEFMRWCRKANTAPMMAVNLGTRGAAEAQALVEYCNFPGGTQWSDLRRANGAADPHAVKVWCLGNEMDGPWQTGHKNADEYGRLAREAAKMMKGVDPSIELVVCGSSNFDMATFGQWEDTVLEHTADVVDYLSLHQYFGNARKAAFADFCAQADRLGQFIDAAVAICDAVTSRKHLAKKIMLSVDEWNVWYHSNPLNGRDPEWTVARRLLEDVYDMADLLVNASAINQMLNRADRVKIACIAQSVNVIAPVMVDKNGRAWKQTIYYPQYYASKYGRGAVLRQAVESPELPIAEPARGAPATLPALSSAVTLNNGEVAIFAVNRHETENLALTATLDGLGKLEIIEHLEIANPDLAAVNSADHQAVGPRTVRESAVKGENVVATLAPTSWNLIRVAVKG